MRQSRPGYRLHAVVRVTEAGVRFRFAMNTSFAQFHVGQVVHHRLFDYRGVIFDVDPVFRGTDEWYRSVAMSRPPKDRPWYHVLMHGTSNTTYVAERNLEADDTGDPITHPDLDRHFIGVADGVYVPRQQGN